jgi:hypothetical protein
MLTLSFVESKRCSAFSTSHSDLRISAFICGSYFFAFFALFCGYPGLLCVSFLSDRGMAVGIERRHAGTSI